MEMMTRPTGVHLKKVPRISDQESAGDILVSCGSCEKSSVVILIFNRIFFWVFDLFGNIHSCQTHHPETQKREAGLNKTLVPSTITIFISSS